MRVVAAALPLLCLLGNTLAAVDLQVVVDISTAQGAPFAHKWKRSFGSGHSALTLRDDWRSQLTLR